MKNFLVSFRNFRNYRYFILGSFYYPNFLFQPFLVSGASMEPNFSSGDYLLVDEISYRFREPQRGEVVVFEPPLGGSYFIKRIIGLPDEKIVIQNGEIIIFDRQGNKMALKEDYLPANIKTFGDLEVTLKSDQYFVLGDNRNFSFDSRSWGHCLGKIVGFTRVRIWPITAAMAFGTPAY